MNIIENYSKKSGFDFQLLSDNFKTFMKTDFPAIILYWKQGNSALLDEKSFIRFNDLKKQYENAFREFNRIKNKNNLYDEFEISEFLSEIEMLLKYTELIPKYLGVSTNKVDVFEDQTIEYFVHQDDTIEKISQMFYGNPEQYDKIISYNNIKYYEIGDINWIGRKLKIPLQNRVEGKVDGIYDVQIGDNIFGKDIAIDFGFKDGDIEVKNGIDCFNQAIQILLEDCYKGSIPENQQIGSELPSIIGKTLGDFSLVFFKNDLEKLFSNEITVKSFFIEDIKVVEDALILSIKIIAINGNSYIFTYDKKDFDINTEGLNFLTQTDFIKQFNKGI
jgi:hypothetical protein